MSVVVTGSSGFLGSALVPFVAKRGHAVTRLVRSGPHESEIHWDPVAGRVDGAALEGMEAVIHLAGDNIAEGRWTAAKKARIRESRVRGTRLLSEALASEPPPVWWTVAQVPPNAFLCASASGYYGDRGVDRHPPRGDGSTCRARLTRVVQCSVPPPENAQEVGPMKHWTRLYTNRGDLFAVAGLTELGDGRLGVAVVAGRGGKWGRQPTLRAAQDQADKWAEELVGAVLPSRWAEVGIQV